MLINISRVLYHACIRLSIGNKSNNVDLKKISVPF